MDSVKIDADSIVLAVPLQVIQRSVQSPVDAVAAHPGRLNHADLQARHGFLFGTLITAHPEQTQCFRPQPAAAGHQRRQRRIRQPQQGRQRHAMHIARRGGHEGMAVQMSVDPQQSEAALTDRRHGGVPHRHGIGVISAEHEQWPAAAQFVVHAVSKSVQVFGQGGLAGRLVRWR